MEKIIFGKTGLFVSKMCLGTLQFKLIELPAKKGGKIIETAFENGVNFVDTADGYDTYKHLAQVRRDYLKQMVISSKAGASTKAEMKKAIDRILSELKLDSVDIFMMHGTYDIKELSTVKKGAWEYLKYAKRKGYVRHIGISTHSARVATDALKIKEIDAMMASMNYLGCGIVNGSKEMMTSALKRAHIKGVGIFAMKPLGGGLLFKQFQRAIKYINGLDYIHAMAIGVIDSDELLLDIKLVNNEPIPAGLAEKVRKIEKKTIVRPWCKACGKCIKHCRQYAIEIIGKIAVVDHSKCVLCGYCGINCPDRAIKIV